MLALQIYSTIFLRLARNCAVVELVPARENDLFDVTHVDGYEDGDWMELI